MKLTIEQSDEQRETEILIRCGGAMDERLRRLIRRIRMYAFSLTGKREGQSYALSSEEIYYIESVEEKTFLYTEHEMYESDLRLYELEEKLRYTDLMRVSKSVILNTGLLRSVRPLLNGRFEATLQNGERVLISRHYLAAFRERFGV